MFDPGLFTGLADTVASKHVDPAAIPNSLFHYTDGNGLMGILGREASIRFSDVLFVNDGSEIFYGIQLFDSVLEDFLQGKSDRDKRFAHKVSEVIREHWKSHRAVIFCLSEENNLLNQWRDYGKGVVSYSIEIDVPSFVRAADCSFRTILFKMIYDRQKQTEILLDLISNLYNMMSKLYDDNFIETDDDETILSFSCALQINWLLYRFKNPAFVAEREWRFMSDISRMPPEGIKHFKDSGLGVVPYYEWRLSDKTAKLPVKSVIVGPSPFAQVSHFALDIFLESMGYKIPSDFSTIPIRR